MEILDKLMDLNNKHDENILFFSGVIDNKLPLR